MDREVAEQVARLRTLGFQVLPVPMPRRRLGGVHLHRFTLDGHIDTVVISVQAFTVAARMRNQFRPSKPLADNHAVWSQHGDLVAVVDEFLDRFYGDDGVATTSRFIGDLDKGNRSTF